MAVVRVMEPSGRCIEYERRQPEKTAFYRIVQEHIETVFAEAEQSGSGYPEHVKHEFERFLSCGVLSAGFARIQCAQPGCTFERLVAYSCKGRCICPSCVSRRMADCASHLVDHVLPFSGKGLIPSLPIRLGTGVTVNLTARRFWIFERIQFDAGLLIQGDSFLPASLGLRLLTQPLPGGVTLGFEPHVVSGFDLNLATMRLYASRRWKHVFVTSGGEFGAKWAVPEPDPVHFLFAGVGAVLLPGYLAVTLEGGSDIVRRHRAMANLTLNLWGVLLSGGGGVSVVSNRHHGQFQAVLTLPLGLMSQDARPYIQAN